MVGVSSAISIALQAAVEREFLDDSTEERQLSQQIVESLEMTRVVRLATSMFWLCAVFMAGVVVLIVRNSATLGDAVLFALLFVGTAVCVHALLLAPWRARIHARIIDARVKHRVTFARVMQAASRVWGAEGLVQQFGDDRG